jgi:hypothetical protein
VTSDHRGKGAGSSQSLALIRLIETSLGLVVVIGVVLAAPIAFDVLYLHLSVGDFSPWLPDLAYTNDRL